AVTTYVGQNYGAGQLKRIRRGMRAAVLLSIGTSLLIAAVMFLFGRELTLLFISSEDPALTEAAGNTAYHYLSVMASCLPVLYLLHAYRSALQGMGNTVIPMVSGIVEFVMRVGAALIIGMTGHRTGIFWAEVAAWAGAAVLLMASYYLSVCRLGKNFQKSDCEKHKDVL
ncbi:MAG: MATE family efflux transporter, partial [Clostridia bacterium]|nr:MATE family efflux transporter [Clostridia bacterium]